MNSDSIFDNLKDKRILIALAFTITFIILTFYYIFKGSSSTLTSQTTTQVNQVNIYNN